VINGNIIETLTLTLTDHKKKLRKAPMPNSVLDAGNLMDLKFR
jgi:hypothetical protein